jgi:hypothetical protein
MIGLRLVAAPSSIDTLALPTPPVRRYDLETVEEVRRGEETWYRRVQVFERDGAKVRHGLEIERVRTRDRETFDLDYIETRRMYDGGVPAPHRVVSTYEKGVLRQRDYVVDGDFTISLRFNESGQEIQAPGAATRGAGRKRDRITHVFDSLYELTP